jgi:hypothetical protein
MNCWELVEGRAEMGIDGEEAIEDSVKVEAAEQLTGQLRLPEPEVFHEASCGYSHPRISAMELERGFRLNQKRSL